MPATTLCLNAILNYNFGSSAYSPTLPATMYFGLSTTLVTIASTGATVAEPSGNGYTRVTLTNNHATWSTSTVRTLHNDVAVTFPQSSGSWGEVLSLFIADSVTTGAGNIWWFNTLAPSIIIQTLTTVSFGIGSIVITMT